MFAVICQWHVNAKLKAQGGTTKADRLQAMRPRRKLAGWPVAIASQAVMTLLSEHVYLDGLQLVDIV